MHHGSRGQTNITSTVFLSMGLVLAWFLKGLILTINLYWIYGQWKLPDLLLSIITSASCIWDWLPLPQRRNLNSFLCDPTGLCIELYIFHILQCVCRSIYRICLNLCSLNFILILRIGKIFNAVELYSILVRDYFYISEIGGRTENQNNKDVMKGGCVMCLCDDCSEGSVCSYLLLLTKCNHGPD